MTKTEFIKKYMHLITVHFSFVELENNPNVRIVESNKDLAEFLEFYIPRYAKYGTWDRRHILQILRDSESSLVRLNDIIASPTDWGLEPFSRQEMVGKALWPIPLATDSRTGKTLILDSNHTICTLLLAGIDMKVACVELVGEQLEALGPDLRLMQS